MNTYSLSDEAIRDLQEICDYLAQTEPKTASRVFDSIRQRCKLLAQFPNMGKSYDRLASNLRGSVIENYIIFYYPRQDGIDVVRVVSGYRDLETLFN